MKTRVSKWFHYTHGVTLYDVQILDHWRDGEMKHYQPDRVLWQTVKTTPDSDEALRAAEALSTGGSTRCIVAEFGQSDLVESPEE